MSAEDWSAKHRTLAAAGLLVLGDDAKEKLQTLPNLMPLIEAASASDTVMLTSRTIDELLAIRSEEHTSELQSRTNLVCRLLLEKKKNIKTQK